MSLTNSEQVISKTMKRLLSILFVLIVLWSCSSPENEGKELAQSMNECAESFIKEK